MTNQKKCPLIIAIALTFSILSGSIWAQASGEFALRKRRTTDGFRVVTANVRQMMKDDYKTGNGWDQRKDICRDAIMAQNADIYCIQENRAAITDYLMKAMPGFTLSNTIYRSKQPINPIMYSTKRFKKMNEGGFWLSPTPDVENSIFEGGTRRVANWVLLKDKVTGKQLCVINAHLQHDSDSVRMLQMDVMLDFAKTLPPGTAAFMTADFNCGMNSGPMKKTTAAGWADSYAVVHGPAEPGATFHGFRGTEGEKKRVKIDHILINKFLKPVAAEISKDSRLVDGVRRYPSDHYFVSAELVYAGKR
ncbi:endonuclease/exonuclease/phosphatase family metal-dependent hydrolase [Ereboglobus sp. PH5-5]|uniref:endonuclease/exonuclease/phosphatase family protein n=1 Tax=unclassified Ereboglobus TaxID=2626932 RepID=UPI002407708F|nr:MULTISPECIES: endonuclease/exonuclease/phosphatase family protein [unclassified Ereboglobus]MDF9826520.1 endonuclease/exonuclease/phosphatase family metal-dependent hydrolase [Ereboglobus sp. PH5-10]MDF9832710.1 endonuclease/exonuclease/phosphatase family metal-dependent hydrolase [Ereboglobus sp. PH5-5]